MAQIKRILLDVLKPHAPSLPEFAQAIADQGAGYQVKLTTVEVDEKTESVAIVIEGDDIRFDDIDDAIKQLGASLHSVDEVEVVGTPADSAKLD